MTTFLRTSLVASATLATVLGAGAVAAETTVLERPGRGTNRIEVTGNKAGDAARPDCGPPRADARAPTTNVNSVNISGQALQGKTIIVTEGGVSCDSRKDNGRTNINSVNIR